MPYIKQEDRERASCEQEGPPLIKTAGELNFAFTDLIVTYWEEHHNYQGINDIIGALEGAKLEFYRRVVAPYENTKIKENGDVY